MCRGTIRVIADITDPDIIQKILDHIEAQPPPVKSAGASQLRNTLGLTGQHRPARSKNFLGDQPNRV